MMSRKFSVLLVLFIFALLYMLSSYGSKPFWNEESVVSSSTESNSKKMLLKNKPTIDKNKTVVTIPSLGKVVGSFLTSFKGKRYSAFRGIPYAKPPIGELRFKDPEPVEPWGVLDATDFGFSCTQLSHEDSAEDCLTLNIFTKNVNPTDLKPVLVYIHGGGFFMGSSSGFNAFYLVDRDVVLVTVNYRLGAFGFLSTGDAEAPGNYGLLDQTLALRWIRDHIIHFGGHSNSVTLMGHSAGAASVEYHILSPHSRGLFKGAIAQSGSALCNWAFSKVSAVENTRRLVKDLNCTRSSSKEVVSCLRKKSLSEIMSSDLRRPQVLGSFPIGYWIPRVDIEREFPFLPGEPEKLLERKQFNPVPLITGIASHEGLSWLTTVTKGKIKELKPNFVEYIPSMCGFQFLPNREDLANKIFKQYFLTKSTTNLDDSAAFEQMLSDCNFNKCIEDSTKLFSNYNNNHPTFHYLFDHNDLNSPIAGSHAGMFGFQTFVTPLIKKEDIYISNMILDFWTTFSSKGEPHSELLPRKWTPVNRVSIHFVKGYLKIKNEETEMNNDSMPFYSRLKYLNEIFV